MERLLNFSFILITAGPLILIIWGYIKGRSEEGLSVRFNKVLVFNSSVLYALAYNLVFFIQELFLALGKRWIGLKAFLYHNNHGWEGTDPRTDLMQGLGAFAIFVLGAFLLLIYPRICHRKSWLRMLVLWLAFHGLIQSLPQLASAPKARQTDTGQALTYLQLGENLEFLLASLSVVVIIVLCIYFARLFLGFARANTAITTSHQRMRWIFYIAILPALLGTVLIFPFKIMPVDRYMSAVFFTIRICTDDPGSVMAGTS